MKSFVALGLVALTSLVAATDPPVKQNPDGTFTCDKPNVNYCAGSSLGTDIIFRCDSKGKGQPGRCSDNTAGQPPLGVGSSLCWQSSPNAGDAACEKNCVVYVEKGGKPPFTLPGCKPTYTPTTTTAKPTTTTPCTTTTTKKPTTTTTPCTTTTTKKPTTTTTPCTTTTTTTPCTTSTTKKPTTTTPCTTSTTSTTPCTTSTTSTTPCTTSTTAPTTVVPPPTTLSTATTVAPVTTSKSPAVVTAGAAVQRQGGAALALVGAAAFLMI